MTGSEFGLERAVPRISWRQGQGHIMLTPIQCSPWDADNGAHPSSSSQLLPHQNPLGRKGGFLPHSLAEDEEAFSVSPYF